MKAKTTALLVALGCCLLIAILMLIVHGEKNNTSKEYIKRIDVSSYSSKEDIDLACAFDLST